MININELWKYVTVAGTAKKLERWGDVLQYALPWAALTAIAFTGDTMAAYRWLYASVITMVIVTLLKYLSNFTPLGRRPNGGRSSFPSGHTAGATLGAAFVLFHFGFVYAIIPIGLAALTGLSRIVSNAHWPRDVIAAMVIATGVMWYFVG